MNISQEFFNVPKSLISRHYTDSNVLPEYRSEFMRDRDRLMYATAFRRLAGKTQIYTVGSDDHRKNRLTHTLEVSQIARTIAAALGLNTDLAEAIALAHDFGHTPFGHAGEQMLHEIMIPNATVVKNSPFYRTNLKTLKDTFDREFPQKIDYLDYAFGFKHNLQSVRVTALLEDSYRGGSDENIGLNLTNYTLYGMMLHSNAFYKHGDKYPNFHHFFDEQMKANGAPAPAWSFEAYIVKWADDIAQWHHDLEDAIRDGALPLSRICDTIKESLGEKLSSDDEQVLDDIKEITKMDRKCLADLSHIVVNTLVNDIIETSKSNFNVLIVEIETKNIDNPETFFNEYEKLGFSLNKENVISFSEKIKSQNFKDVIRASIHHSRNVVRMNEKGCYIIRKLFEAYYAHPQQLPDGPILHILVDIKLDNYETIDKAKKAAIGDARIAFENVLKNPNIFTKCILMRRICDHIASMTDKYAVEEYNNLYG